MNYLISFAVLLACLYTGIGFQELTHIPIPGSIFGMLLLFGLLASGILPSHWAKPSCHLLIKNMALLFVPVGVGLMNHLHLIASNVVPILLSIYGSSLVVFIVISLGIHHKEKEKEL